MNYVINQLVFNLKLTFSCLFRNGTCVLEKHLVNILTGCSCSVTKSYLFCDPMDCSLPDSSVHGVSQARILEWVTISSSRGSS